MRLRHYFHVFAVKEWKSIVAEHIDALASSGLAAEVHPLRLGIVGDKDERKEVFRYCSSRMPTLVVAQADEGWEQVTMAELEKDDGSWDAVLYAHTKGVNVPSLWNDMWRQSM